MIAEALFYLGFALTVHAVIVALAAVVGRVCQRIEKGQ